MMHHVHIGAFVIDIFLFVTTKPIAHSGRCVCIQKCVGEFGMDTGQSVVTGQQWNVKSPA